MITCCYAAALAAVGCYLMLPPIHGDQFVSAPLSQWEQVNSFDTASECKNYAAAWSSRLRHGHLNDPNTENQVWQIDRSRCIATDDPRLKEN